MAAGLRYVSDDSAGITRKRRSNDFSAVAVDEGRVERIRIWFSTASPPKGSSNCLACFYG